MTNLFSTTLYDKNDNELFEDDIVNNIEEFADPMYNPYKIEFDHGSFIMRSIPYPYKTIVLRSMLETKEGEYISNFGNVVNIVSNNLPVELVRGVNKPNGELE